jgi:hypothetical protein
VKTSDSHYDKNYYKGIYWHGATVGWLMEEGFKVGLNQYGETLSKQSFIWLHANQQYARLQAVKSLDAVKRRIANDPLKPFADRPGDVAGPYVYRVKFDPTATILNLWDKSLTPALCDRVLRAIDKTSRQVNWLKWTCNRPFRGLAHAAGYLGVRRARDTLLAEDHGWFLWLNKELGLVRLEGRDNERYRRLALFCENAEIDIIKHPKASFHANGARRRNDADRFAEWAIMRLQRKIMDPKTGTPKIRRTYKIIGVYGVV